MSLSSDELSLLQAMATAGGPVGMFDAIATVNPPPSTAQPAHHIVWQSRQVELIDTFLELYRMGMLGEVVPANGSTGDMYALTADGEAEVRATERPRKTR